MMRDKSFDYREAPETLDFNKIKVGVKTLDDAVLNLGSLSGNRKNRFDKATIKLLDLE